MSIHFQFSRANNDFRKTLVDSVPLADPLLKVLLQEEGNAVSEASKSIQGATQKVIGVKDSIVGYFGDDKPAKSAEKPAPAKSMPHAYTQCVSKCFTWKCYQLIYELWNKIGTSSSAVVSPPLPSITAPKPSAAAESPASKQPTPAAESKAAKQTAAKPQAEPKPSEPIKLPPVLTQSLPQT